MSDQTRSATYPQSRLAPPFDLVDVAREIERADAALATSATGQLLVILDQIRKLQQQATDLLEEIRSSQNLHRVACNFVKKVGHTYHLYEREDGERYLSLLSPDDWRSAPPHAHVGSFRLEPDMTWTAAEKTQKLDAERDLLLSAVGASIPLLEPARRT
jgi:hypothetical protein